VLHKLSAPSSIEAGQAYERALHLAHPGFFGRHAPKVTQQHVTESLVHSLLLSNSSKVPGFSGLLQQHGVRATDASDGAAAASVAAKPPLVQLLSRVAVRYYYHVMHNPLDVLLQLTAGCELLFQLLSPHQQLSCMADILMVLSCPTLEKLA
jgi:hypothetical protein